MIYNYGDVFCHIENISHLHIIGNVSTEQPIIHCKHVEVLDLVSVFNITHLMIKNLQFCGCGAIIASQAVRVLDTHTLV